MNRLKEKTKDANLPRVVVLSASSINPLLYHTQPWLVHVVVYYAFWHIYQDLEAAEKLYMHARQNGDLEVDVRFIEPPALKEGENNGNVRLTKDELSPVVTYADLAVAMVKAGEDEGLELRKIGIVVDGEELSPPSGIALTVLTGLLWTFAPLVMRLLKYVGVH